jgi:integrase
MIWKSFQSWLLEAKITSVSTATVLKFLIFLRGERGLATNTILSYKSALRVPLKAAFGLDLNSWIFKEASRALFLDKPNSPKSVPSWNLDKVLVLLQNPPFVGQLSRRNSLMKTLFLTALACGNRVSELAAIVRSGIIFLDNPTRVVLPVSPGFLFKNQRLNRAPPNIEALALGSPNLCPVVCIRELLRRPPGPGDRLFSNALGGALAAPAISRLLCEVIEKADPGSFPKGHDIRKVATSLAWTRGLSPQAIADRAFWRSSSVFVDRYLHERLPIRDCVALNTLG